MITAVQNEKQMPRGVAEIIAKAAGVSKSLVYSVNNGRRNNIVVDELIQLYYEDRLEFANRVEREIQATILLQNIKSKMN